MRVRERLAIGERFQASVFNGSVRHVVIVQAEVVTQLVDHGVAHFAYDLTPIADDAQDRPAEDGDLVGKCRKHVVRPPRACHTAIDAEKLSVRILEEIEILV